MQSVLFFSIVILNSLFPFNAVFKIRLYCAADFIILLFLQGKIRTLIDDTFFFAQLVIHFFQHSNVLRNHWTEY